MGNSVINRGHTSLFYRTAKISEQAYPLLSMRLSYCLLSNSLIINRALQYLYPAVFVFDLL